MTENKKETLLEKLKKRMSEMILEPADALNAREEEDYDGCGLKSDD